MSSCSESGPAGTGPGPSRCSSCSGSSGRCRTRRRVRRRPGWTGSGWGRSRSCRPGPRRRRRRSPGRSTRRQSRRRCSRAAPGSGSTGQLSSALSSPSSSASASGVIGMMGPRSASPPQAMRTPSERKERRARARSFFTTASPSTPGLPRERRGASPSPVLRRHPSVELVAGARIPARRRRHRGPGDDARGGRARRPTRSEPGGRRTAAADAPARRTVSKEAGPSTSRGSQGATELKAGGQRAMLRATSDRLRGGLLRGRSATVPRRTARPAHRA